MTARPRDHAGWLVTEGGRTVAAAARECGLSWPVAHQAFAQRADPLLEQPPAPVAHLGIDEHRRGRPRWQRTISGWEDEIVAAVLTGVTNARAEALNRLAKLEARKAYSFSNPASQRRRVQVACTRASRRALAATKRRSHQVTGQQPDPG